MGKHWLKRGLKFVLCAVAVLVVAGFVVMSLWNWLIPALFGWPAVGFGQALGLLALSRILFGGLRRGPGGPMHWRGRMTERWERMTPEEREKFREGLKGRCGHGAPDAPEPTA